MKYLFFILFFLPQIIVSQTINQIDEKGQKQGVWKKTFENGNLRYQGFFLNNLPSGISSISSLGVTFPTRISPE